MRLAIVSAMAQEQAGLPEALAARFAFVPQGAWWVSGRDTGARPPLALSFALCGIGKVAAAMTATRLIETGQPDAIVFTGVAGGLGRGVQRGDVVLATELLQHDLDASPIFPRYEVPLSGTSRFVVDAAWRQRLLGALDGLPHRVHQGLIISGDRFVSTTAEAQDLQARLPDALAVEMEGAALAQVCHAYRTPFAVVRSISDRADDEAHGDFNDFIEQVAAQVSHQVLTALVDGLIHSPGQTGTGDIQSAH
jgi:adenosylhomocysteine nucleosidase